MTEFVIREFLQEDASQLLSLMRQLAEFEDYIDDFAVTEASIIANGLGPDRKFSAFVAAANNHIIGMAVTYVIPWTYSLRPRLVLKELFIDPKHRGRGIGRELVFAVLEYARSLDADSLNWTVLNGNTRAEDFYLSIGGNRDLKWTNWMRPIEETMHS